MSAPSPNPPSRQSIIDAVRATAVAIGHQPSQEDFLRHSQITRYWITHHFFSWNQCLSAAGFKPIGHRNRYSDDQLFIYWGTLVRRLGRLPTAKEYSENNSGLCNMATLIRRFRAWEDIPRLFRRFADDKPDWADLLPLLPDPNEPESPLSTLSILHAAGADLPSGNQLPAACLPRHRGLPGRTIFGAPFTLNPFPNEPTEELGVVFLFALLARNFGYVIENIQSRFPDCTARRHVGPNHWEQVTIEFEFESRNFLHHGHAPEACDVIVCWTHNWPECPRQIEVLELAPIVKRTIPDSPS